MQTNTAFKPIKTKRNRHELDDLPEAQARSRKLGKRDRKALRQQKRIFSEV